jgi:predicted Zn finger-like uncharacterized protein
MKIPCVSCQSIFLLDSNLVKPTGSLVRCSKCKYIFLVYPPSYDDKPITRDTNIDQSILFDLFNVERKNLTKEVIDQTQGVIASHRIDEIASVNDFEEEEDQISEGIDLEYADLPDLSDFEEMIDWDESPDAVE